MALPHQQKTFRPQPIRLLVGLHYLKHTYNESDESVVERFLENPYDGNADIHIVGQRNRGRPKTRTQRKWMRRRNAIEPKIGHLKSENRMNRNYLKGITGDRINAYLSGCGANLRKLLTVFFLSFFIFDRIIKEFVKIFSKNCQL